jgi:hypothetical protein
MSDVKVINIIVPLNWKVPDIINELSINENAFILTMGCEIIKEARSIVSNLSEQEIYKKIKLESKENIEKLELDVFVQKEVNKQIELNMKIFYEKQLDQLKGQNKQLVQQITEFEDENREKIRKELEKMHEKYEIIVDGKEKTIEKLSVSYEKLINNINTTNNKSSSHKGVEGEKKFEDLAQTFIDFKGFELKDKHSQGGEGDFHIHFDEFDVLVDAKNYKTAVPGREREKIKNDLLKNEHINFAWLVSLNTAIDKYDRAPIMTEWVSTDKCIIYINNLMSYEEPKKILRIAWFYCNELIRLIQYTKENKDITELKDIKDKQYKMIDRIKLARKNIRELNTTITVFKKQIDMMDYELKELIEWEAEGLIESNYVVFDEWWDKNIEFVSVEENVIVSTELWLKFKVDNKNLLKEFDITIEKFKQFIKLKIAPSNIIIRNTNKGAFDIRGIKVKKEKEMEMEIELDNKVVEQVNKKVYKKDKYFFDEEMDTNILKEYTEKKKDIMIISKKKNIEPWQVISVLVKYKIIEKREEANGYDKYKDTDCYKKRKDKD